MPGHKIIVVIGGNANHGKDTLADLLAERIPSSRRDAYANPLKVCVHLKTGIPMDILHGPASVKNDVRFGRYEKSPRQLMQEEGEEARQRIGKTIWMDRLLDRSVSEPERVSIVSDGRHPEEEFIQLRETLPENCLFFGVRVTRANEPILRGHVSEDRVADAPDSLFNFVAKNDGTLEDLALTADQLADAIVLTAKHGRLSGWVIRCPDGRRLAEAIVSESNAKILAIQKMIPCAVCDGVDEHTIEAAVFDRIVQP